MKQQSGFTLIELVVVIVLLGILAAAATAKFEDLASEARIAAVKGVTGEIASGSAINFGKRSINSLNGVAITGCGDSAALLQQGAIPAGYNAPTTVTACGGAAGTVAVCNLADSNLATANQDYTIICIP
jgi:MSHA pilin protein MshA